MRAGILVVTCMVALAGCSPDALPLGESGAEGAAAEQPNPAARGVQRANADIANGTRQILYYGKPWSVGEPLIDDSTGLPVKIVSGCCVTTEFTEEIDAYNRRMREEVSK